MNESVNDISKALKENKVMAISNDFLKEIACAIKDIQRAGERSNYTETSAALLGAMYSIGEALLNEVETSEREAR